MPSWTQFSTGKRSEWLARGDGQSPSREVGGTSPSQKWLDMELPPDPRIIQRHDYAESHRNGCVHPIEVSGVFDRRIRSEKGSCARQELRKLQREVSTHLFLLFRVVYPLHLDPSPRPTLIRGANPFSPWACDAGRDLFERANKDHDQPHPRRSFPRSSIGAGGCFQQMINSEPES